MLSPHELSQRAIDLVAAWSEGVSVPERAGDYHVESPAHGRLRVHARSRRGVRLRALVVVLWRAGRRIGEALALAETDLERSRGSLLVRHGKGDKRRGAS